MSALKEKIPGFLNSKIKVLLLIFLVNLPLMIGAFDATNWSDDYQHTNLIVVKATFSPFIPMLFEPWGGDAQGGHFAPVYALINCLIGFVSLDPRFFHFIIVLVYILTAYVIYRFILEYNQDRTVGLLAACLFSLNYYIGFFGLTWNTMHVHVTNTFFGLTALYFLLRHLKTDKTVYLLGCCLFLLLAILNIENGFIFYPVMMLMLFFFWRRNKLVFKKGLKAGLILTLVMTAYPLGSYLSLGHAMPLAHRFEKERSIQNYAYLTNQLFVNSTGLTAFYNHLIFNRLKDMGELKEAIKKFLRENNKNDLKKLHGNYWALLLAAGFFTLLAGVFLMVQVLTRVKGEMRLFLWLYGALFLIFLFVYFRIDVVNALSIFSSILLAQMVISFLREKESRKRRVGAGFLGLVLLASITTWCDRFEDCYRTAYFSLSTAAIKGPDRIYNEMNRQIGHFSRNGLYFFTHDYSRYHETTGFERIGDMIDVSDFMCYNATVYRDDFLKTDLVEKYKNSSFVKFYNDVFKNNSNYKHIFVASREEALDYLRKNRVDPGKVDAVYVSKDYEVFYLNKGTSRKVFNMEKGEPDESI